MSDFKIMVIRHAEKPNDPPPAYGVNDQGEQDSHELTVRGWQRAGALAALFAPWTAPARLAGLAVPLSIFATEPVSGSESRRPHHTVKPLADLLGVSIDLGFPEGSEGDLVATAVRSASPVLIAWHHQDIPTIANLILGNATTAPQNWPGNRFDVVWVFDRTDGVWSFSQVPQMLLRGDSPLPIPMP
jgi:hypothetical protein